MTYKELFDALDKSDMGVQEKYLILYVLLQWVRDHGAAPADLIDLSS